MQGGWGRLPNSVFYQLKGSIGMVDQRLLLRRGQGKSSRRRRIAGARDRLGLLSILVWPCLSSIAPGLILSAETSGCGR